MWKPATDLIFLFIILGTCGEVVRAMQCKKETEKKGK